MTDLRASAKRLLTKYGDLASLSYTTGGTINPATGQGTAGTTTTLTANGYPSRFKGSDVNGTSILSSDIRFVCEYTDDLPQVGWDVELLGKTYRVMDRWRTRSEQRDLIWILQLRAN